mmetsp:Transcript_2042/g.6472  ORF Transcript_2042/g.6472 Transcript_2042/m.6472 type:complete len:244 (+) Transcript_2042:116-847(+)
MRLRSVRVLGDGGRLAAPVRQQADGTQGGNAYDSNAQGASDDCDDRRHGKARLFLVAHGTKAGVARLLVNATADDRATEVVATLIVHVKEGGVTLVDDRAGRQRVTVTLGHALPGNVLGAAVQLRVPQRVANLQAQKRVAPAQGVHNLKGGHGIAVRVNVVLEGERRRRRADRLGSSCQAKERLHRVRHRVLGERGAGCRRRNLSDDRERGHASVRGERTHRLRAAVVVGKVGRPNPIWLGRV